MKSEERKGKYDEGKYLEKFAADEIDERSADGIIPQRERGDSFLPPPVQIR